MAITTTTRLECKKNPDGGFDMVWITETHLGVARNETTTLTITDTFNRSPAWSEVTRKAMADIQARAGELVKELTTKGYFLR